MFERIASDLQKRLGVERTGEQCCTRYKTVCKRKKTAVTENGRSGNSPQDVPYEDELEKIKWLDDSLEPEVVRDASGIVSCKSKPVDSEEAQDSQQESKSAAKNRKKASTPRMRDMSLFFEKMEEMEERKVKRRAEREAEKEAEKEKRRALKQERREEMHREKMQLLRKVLGLDDTEQ